MSVAFRSTDVSASPARNHAEAIVATDGELLMRFVRQRNHDAFAQIVQRHGRLVWMICRQVLRRHQDVEDSFQATFLILAERAWSIRASDSAAAWLFKVAQRTAIAARRKRARRREETLVDEPSADRESLRMIDNREMLYILLHEIQSLPDRYQTPLVMRYLEGQSRRAIAEQTDSTVSQIQGRLARGRRMLRSRFLRRGVSLSLAAGAVASTTTAANAAVTSALVESTAKTCLTMKTSGSVGGLSPAVLALTNEGIKTMWFAFASKCTAVASTVALTAGIVWAAQQGGNGNAGAQAAAANAVNLQVVSGKPATGASGQSAAAKDGASNLEQPSEKLQKRIEATASELNERMDQKAQQSAFLEIEQLEKEGLRRQAEHLQGWLAELSTPPATSSGEELSKEAKDQRTQLRDKVALQLNGVKDELKKQIQKTAEASAKVERTQMIIAHRQREFDELSRIRLQTELAEEMTTASQPRSAAPISAATGAAAVARPPADYVLLPDDVLMIRAKGALADGPIENSFRVDTMGTVALGPQYGSVKVEGLNAGQAQNEIRRKLSEFAFAPEGLGVQTEIVAWHGNAASARQKLDQSNRELEKLQAENAKLKKELEQYSKPIGRSR